MKIIHCSAPKPQPSRPIKRFTPPPPAAPPVEHPQVRSSNEVAAHAVRVASSPGGIDPTQQRY
jgi:hypothetical protein